MTMEENIDNGLNEGEYCWLCETMTQDPDNPNLYHSKPRKVTDKPTVCRDHKRRR